MSLYNLMHGFNHATFLILPMLGKHPDEYPRFRDCFIGEPHRTDELGFAGIPKRELTISKDDRLICVYTRTGGGNRDDYATQIDEMREMPGFIRDYDDEFDNTYATFVFRCPQRWESDYDKLTGGELKDVSDEYIKEIGRVFPKLKDQFDRIFAVLNETDKEP